MTNLPLSNELYLHYSKIAQENIEKFKIGTFRDCKTREEFSNYLLNVFIAHYGLRCNCCDCQDWQFNSASGHYNKCDLWKFCHIVNRCLDWSEERAKTQSRSDELGEKK